MLPVSLLFASLSLFSKAFAFDNSRFDNVSAISRADSFSLTYDGQVVVYVLVFPNFEVVNGDQDTGVRTRMVPPTWETPQTTRSDFRSIAM